MAKTMNQVNGTVVTTQNPVLIPGLNHIGQSFYITFLKGQPKSLGAVHFSLLIVLGVEAFGSTEIILICMILVQLSLVGLLIILDNTTTVYTGISFWGSAFYLIAVGLTLGAKSKQSRCLVGGALGMHIFCSIISISEVIIIVFDCLFYIPDYTFGCDNQYLPSQCSEYLRIIYEIRLGTLIILLVVSALQFSIALSISVFACKSLYQPIPQPQVYVINHPYGYIPSPETTQP